jgi:hypothetical protein
VVPRPPPALAICGATKEPGRPAISRRWPRPRWDWLPRRHSAPFPAGCQRSCTRRTRWRGGEQRARLAVALARAWAYGYDPARAARFAAAQLLVHWGPDDLDERLSITARLEDTVAHVADAEPRMSAHLWRLTTALECLDLPGVRRQLRALDLLAAESGTARVRFFAASRRGMYALLTGDLDAAGRAVREVAAAGAEAGEPDALLIGHMLAAGIARQAGDVAALAREAALYEEFGVSAGSRGTLTGC